MGNVYLVLERTISEHRNTIWNMNAATLESPTPLTQQRITTSDMLVAEPTPTVRELPKATNGNSVKPAAPKSHKWLSRSLAALALLSVGLAVRTYYINHILPFETTDDAFIDAHVTPVAPQVAGRVMELLVQDNQEVKQGDVLLTIDPRDYQSKLDQALANLAAAKSRWAQANAQFAVDQAKVGQEKAAVIAAEAEAKRAESDSKRYQAVGVGGISVSQLDLAATQARSAAAQVQVVRNKQFAAEAQVGLSQANIQTALAEIQRNEAAVRQAELDLSYTKVLAPESGYVTHRTVESGAYVQTGQSLLAVVPKDVWVVANFKETQLENMQPGQPVEVKVDAYPQIKFKGHVDSIQAGAGARFSLLPPENASGNYVKVVQRVPVKIVLENAANTGYVLGAGMSVEPEVRVR